MFRGTPRAFATDPRALAVARGIVARGLDAAYLPAQRWFAYLPFEHAEDLAAQTESLVLFERLRGDPASASPIAYAMRHYAVIERFGRFPHRNAILGRDVDARRRRVPRDARLVLLALPTSSSRVGIVTSECSVRCTGHLFAISSSFARCAASSAPSSRITRSIRSILPSRVSHSAQSAAWIWSCFSSTSTRSSGSPFRSA